MDVPYHSTKELAWFDSAVRSTNDKVAQPWRLLRLVRPVGGRIKEKLPVRVLVPHRYRYE
eukprot:scaffold456434_cov20-Prasinocladus_malaysianus.AAC.1